MANLAVTLMLKRKQFEKGFFHLALSAWVAVATLLLGSNAALFADTAHRPVRLALTFSAFQKIDENDIRAAMKVWIMALAQEQGIPVDPDPNLHRTVEDLIRFARANPVDGFGVTTPEYASLSREISFDLFATCTIGGRDEVVYLLLVHQDSDFKRLSQLAGCSLNIVDDPHMSLAMIWLDTALMEEKLKRTADFFKEVTMDRRVSQVALPVFFGKVDACMVTRESFEVMSTLNPQIKKQLRILSSSPPLVPVGFAFRQNSTSPYRQQVLEVLARLEDGPAGRQILELSQAEAFHVHDISCLDKSLELLKKQQQLLKSH